MTTEHTDRAQHQQPYGQLVKLLPAPAAQAGRLTRIRQAIAAFFDQRAVPWLWARDDDLRFWCRYTARPWLRRRGRDIEAALMGGWPTTAAWLRALVYLTAYAALVGIVDSVIPLVVGFWQHTMVGAHHSGVVATVTRPVHDYLVTHGGLPADSVTVWALWQTAGPVLFIAGAIGFTSARALWVAYGAATAAMVWAATPETGRPVATALAVACWVLLSTIALHGLRLRPVLVVPVLVRIKPKITVKAATGRPKPTDSGPVDSFGDADQ
ncbi:hypothetical protein P3T36_006354 [Kitasatospora sp. MAP12-15]|uniref:hypothetical protein n=1 Tax=unclassified Kitasatospora TaxID=2633591 RepID=UPI0024751B6F|nr:hypothetical protein [Kitasatospora sp. MAP12-44]MDH6107895.1 hypothetical protein [Kitasatospora sp. MAP12-44]